MSVTFSQRVAHLRASEIRELLKLTQRPEVISFGGGLPAAESFPVAALKAAAARVLDEHASLALQYSTTEGYLPLRQWIASRMEVVHGATVAAERVVVTTASQQGLDLTGKVFLDEGDEVLCESPTYLGAIQAFRAYGARFVEVPTDDDGMLPDELERLLRTCQHPRVIYTVPDYQNPSGRTWSLPRRRALLEIARHHAVVVLEDCPYVEVRFAGTQVPPLVALDTTGQVVHLGTFSKILCPGLRLGWVTAAPEILEKYVLAKQGADLHSSTFAQMLAVECLAGCDIDTHLGRVRAMYRSRRDAMVRTLETELPPGCHFTRPDGGLFLWVELPHEISGRDLLVRALRRDVAFVPGGAFFPNGGHENHIRLNYSCMTEERIIEGVKRLAAALHELMLQQRPAA